MQLHVTGSLELLEDQVVHLGACLGQGRGDDRQTTAVLDVTCRTEEPFGFVQGLCFHTAGQYLSARWRYGVVRASEARDRVQQDHYIVTALYESFRFLVNDIRYANVVLCRLVEGRSNDLGVDAALHIRYFLGALVNEQHDHIDLGVVVQDRICQLLKQHRLTGLGLRYDQTALTLTDRRE